MKTEIQIDPGCREPKLILVTPELTPAQQRLMEQLGREASLTIPGYQNGTVTLLPVPSIYRFYTSGQRVLGETARETYTIRLRLYELETLLQGTDFIRISQGELINLALTEQFDLSFSGTVRVRLKNGQETYVSRRYVKKLKQTLGI